jgi:hypothetical protein
MPMLPNWILETEHKYDDPSTLRGVQPYSLDESNAARLWKLSEQMTGITFHAN